jgi:hypothetical protein
MKKKFFSLFLFIIVFVSACTNGTNITREEKITVYKSPTCGCCEGWSTYMRQQGFEVEVISVVDLDTIKDKYNIPKNLESCHTAIVGDYVVEGHIPIDVVDKLLEEKPDIDGIALPRMPSGSPGMPGPKTGEWIIYGLEEGQYSEYTRV